MQVSRRNFHIEKSFSNLKDIRKLKSSTIFSMNQAMKSVVKTMPINSDEYVMVQSLCAHAVDEDVINTKAGKWADFQKLLLKVRLQIDFLHCVSNCCFYSLKLKCTCGKVSLSCEKMLLHCLYGGQQFNCIDIFVTILTDEGQSVQIEQHSIGTHWTIVTTPFIKNIFSRTLLFIQRCKSEIYYKIKIQVSI